MNELLVSHKNVQAHADSVKALRAYSFRHLFCNSDIFSPIDALMLEAHGLYADFMHEVPVS